MSKATGPNPEEREYPMPAPGHALPLEVWEQVEADAARIREEDGDPEPLNQDTIAQLMACADEPEDR